MRRAPAARSWSSKHPGWSICRLQSEVTEDDDSAGELTSLPELAAPFQLSSVLTERRRKSQPRVTDVINAFFLVFFCLFLSFLVVLNQRDHAQASAGNEGVSTTEWEVTQLGTETAPLGS